MYEVIGHPTIEAGHGEELYGGLWRGEEGASEREVYPIGGSVGETSVDEPPPGGGLEADMEEEVWKGGVVSQELVRGGEDDVPGVGDGAGGGVGMSFEECLACGLILFLEDKENLKGSPAFDDGEEEAEEVVFGIIAGCPVPLGSEFEGGVVGDEGRA